MGRESATETKNEIRVLYCRMFELKRLNKQEKKSSQVICERKQK
jgi:hypothetical protein